MSDHLCRRCNRWPRHGRKCLYCASCLVGMGGPGRDATPRDREHWRETRRIAAEQTRKGDPQT